MVRLRKNGGFFFLLLFLVLFTQLPYLVAQLESNDSVVFSGFLFNPLDGHTYLSKMRQGWDGKWLFELTYSSEESKPAFLFVFYLLLGHLSRVLGIDLLTTFHLARFAATIALFFALKKFFECYFKERAVVELALIWTVFGSGIGWLAMLFGAFTPDFWVAEGYVFLSIFANPHFPLSIAIMVWILTAIYPAEGKHRGLWGIVIASLALANLSPFAWIIVGLVIGIISLFSYIKVISLSRKAILLRTALFGIGGAPFLLYQFYIVRMDDVLAEWNRQNVTPSPNVLLFVLGYFPLLVWTVWGAIREIRKREFRFLVPFIWIFVSLGLVYFPSSLQRRFMIGLYVPLVALALGGMREFLEEKYIHSKKSIQLLMKLSIAFSLITNVVILFATLQAVKRYDPSLYLYRQEIEAFEWLETHLPARSVVLASPISGTFIPAWTGLRVVYGHPFESIRAEEKIRMIEKFYRGDLSLQDQESFLKYNSVKAILLGIREQEFSSADMELTLDQLYPLGYQCGQTKIYQVIP